MTTVLDWQDDLVIMGGGKFDSRRRYLRAGTGAGAFAVPSPSKTLDILSGGGNNVAWRYSVNGYVISFATGMSPSSFNATVTIVKTQ